MKKLAKTVLIILISAKMHGQSNLSANANLQGHPAVNDSVPVTMAAGKQYKASGWRTLWWGEHYRREWATPVPFPALNISTIDGGLTPVKVGGGHESTSLRLLSANGREYVLRTMDKSHDAIVPDELKGTFLNDIANDQVSTAHPYGPIAIAGMAEAISIFHTNPKIYYVPFDTALGAFKDIYANRLALLEERPSGKGWKHSDLFADADKIVNSAELVNRFDASTKNSVDQKMFLRVRFFDMIVNDWDRHADQWVWAEKKTGQNHLYIPIGRDRDQAFSRTNGIALYMASLPWAFRPIQNFTSNIEDIRGQNYSARNLDQKFLNELTKDDWKQTINFIQTKLTDSVIKSAVNTMPAEVNKISGDFVINRLEERINNLSNYGMRYYSMLSKKATITGAAENEQFVVDLDKDNEVTVTGLRSGTDTFYHRVFDRQDTKEINIYGLGGDDEYILKGNAKNDFIIRFIGGDGNNAYKTEEGKIDGKRVRIYDSLYLEGISHNNFKVNQHWDSLYRYTPASVKYDWYIPMFVPGYNKDDGVTIGLGLFYKKQQWGKSPFGWEQRLTVDYATDTRAVGFGYKGLFKSVFGKWDLDLTSFYKGPSYTFNYYGFGNETEVGDYDKSYFMVKGNDFFLSPGVSRTWRSSYLRFGLQYENVKILHSQDKFITSPGSKPDTSVFSAINFAGVNGQYTFSNAGDERNRTKGFQLTGGFSYLNNLNNTDRKMLKLNGAASIYYTFFNRLTFAHRTGAETIFGDYEFYQASTIGGNNNLRGYWRNRFAGKSDFYQNTELRLALFDFKGYVLRGKFGIYSFLDDGRIWVEDDNSSKLHTGCGGGIFMLPYNKMPLTLSYAKSSETSMITLKAGFFF